MKQRIGILMFLSILVTMAGVGRLYAQETGAAPATPAMAEGQAVGSGQPAAGEKDPLREQTIYIPYERLQNVFEKPGRGVFVPYEKFQELWQAARAQARQQEPPKRPVDAVITEIDNEATIADQVVNVRATIQIEILGTGWVQVPLRLGSAAIRSAKIGDAPARIVLDPQSGHQLLWLKEGDQPQQIELLLEYTRAFTKTPGQSSVEFDAPQAPINRWRIRVPDAGMSVQVEPMIAATRAPQDGAPEGAPDAATPPAATDLLAFVGAAPTVKISWNSRAEGAAGLEAFATVQTEQQMVVSEGVARSSIKLDYEISRAKLSQLVLEVPPDQKVVNVFDRNVQRWAFEAAEGKQTIRVDLFEATQGQQSLVVELEQFINAAEAAYQVALPLVRAVGVGRQQGIVVVRLDEGLQGEAVTRTGLLQLDQNDLPESLRGTPWQFAYRYGAVPYELVLNVEKVLPRISVTELVEAELTAEKLALAWQGLYTIQDAGLFQLRLDLPDGFEVRTIEGVTIGDNAAPAAVDAYHRVSADANTWLVNLSSKAFGKVGIRAQLERTLSDPNLLSPTGTESTIEVPLPRATTADVEFAQGSLVVSAPDSLHVNPAQVEGLRDISFEEAIQTIPATPASSKPVRPVLAYAFAKGTAKLSVTAERRPPQVTVNQLLRAEVDSGVVKFNVALYHDINYSGVKSLRIDLPATLTTVHNNSPSLRKEEITPQPDDVAEGYTAWSFAAETELLGKVEVLLAWEQKIDELGIGKRVDIPIPRLIPRNVDRAVGQIVISKSESIDVQPTGTPSGLTPIDPQKDVLPAGRSDNAAMAFEFVGDWSLVIQATRYELEASKLTSIERGVVRIVALSAQDNDQLSIQAIYRMRSARQRLAIQVPESAVFDAQPLRIDGRAVTPEKEGTVIFAPLADQEIDKPFVLELRYSVEGSAAQLDLPFFPDDPAVQRVYLCAYLPEHRVLVGSRGPWSDEERSEVVPLPFRLRGMNDAELIQWVTEGNAAATSSAQTFPIGKSVLHVYSALRPQPAPDGSLHLSTMSRRGFHAMVIVLVAAIGLPLFRRSVRVQLVLLLLLAAIVLLIGVFMPELARSLLTGVFPIALAILILIWLIGHATKLPWSRRDVRPAPASPITAGASAPPPAMGPVKAVGAPPGLEASPPADEPDEYPMTDDTSAEGGKRDE